MSKNLINGVFKLDSTQTNFEKEKRLINHKEILGKTKSKNTEFAIKNNLQSKTIKYNSIIKHINQQNIRESLYSEKFFKKRPLQNEHSKRGESLLPPIKTHG